MSFYNSNNTNSLDRFFRIYYRFVIDESRAIIAHSHYQGLFYDVAHFSSGGTQSVLAFFVER